MKSQSKRQTGSFPCPHLQALGPRAQVREPTAPSGGRERAQPGSKHEIHYQEMGQGTDQAAGGHWLYPHVHHEQGTSTVSEHLSYERLC